MSTKPTGCATCGSPLEKPKRNHNKANSGTRIPASLWAASVEADPFCSAECCRIFHGLGVTTGDFGSCPDCGKKHTVGVARPNGNRCQPCSDAYRKKRQRRFDVKGCCAGCGVSHAEVTLGCPTCLDRSRRRWRRQNDPVFRERERDRDRRRRKAPPLNPEEHRALSSARRLAAVEPSLTKSAPAMRRDFAAPVTERDGELTLTQTAA